VNWPKTSVGGIRHSHLSSSPPATSCSPPDRPHFVMPSWVSHSIWQLQTTLLA
jgi:hypothetical protein